MTILRRTLSEMSPGDGMEMLLQRLGKTRTNAEFLMSIRNP
jgi:transcription termination factor Rho